MKVRHCIKTPINLVPPLYHNFIWKRHLSRHVCLTILHAPVWHIVKCIQWAHTSQLFIICYMVSENDC
jgi:hypothetical protein